MKKLLALICIGLMICSFVLAEETEENVPRTKSMGIGREEWIERYKAVPEKIEPDHTPVYFFNIGLTDDRLYYYASPMKYVDFYIGCEDTTEEVFAVLIQSDWAKAKEDVDAIYVGRFLAEGFARMVYATTPDITQEDFAKVVALIEALGNTEVPVINNSIDVENVRYVCSMANGIVSYGVRSIDVFASEEEFQKYREETKKDTYATESAIESYFHIR